MADITPINEQKAPPDMREVMLELNEILRRIALEFTQLRVINAELKLRIKKLEEHNG